MSAEVTHRSALSDLVKSQKPHTTKVPESSKGIEQFSEKMKEQSDFVMKAMLAAMANQDPENPMKPGEILQAMNSIAEANISIEVGKQTFEAAKAQREGAFAQAGRMCGQKVAIDDGVRMLKAGVPVTFNYNINAGKLPANAVVQSQISVLTEDGKKVFSKDRSSATVGRNSFTWNGVDDDGNVVEGNHRIEVKASYTIGGNESTRTALTVDTAREGTIDTVNVDSDGAITSYIVDGVETPRSSIKQFIRDKSAESSETTDISEYFEYVGKTVTIEENKVQFTGSNSTKVPFMSDAQVKGAKIRISFYDDKNKFVAMAEKDKLSLVEGQNYFIWDGAAVKSSEAIQELKKGEIPFIQVANGTYKHKTEIYDKASDTWTTLSDSTQIKVKGVEKGDGTVYLLSDNGLKFDAKYAKAGANSADAPSIQTLLDQAGTYTNKAAKLPNNIIYHKRDAGYTHDQLSFVIPELDNATQKLGAVTFKIFDEQNKLVSEISKSKDDINALVTKFVGFENLDENSQKEVNDQASHKFNTGYGNPPLLTYDKLSDARKKIMDPIIQTGLTARTFFNKAGQGLAFPWPGTSSNGAQVQNGRYTYATEYQVLNAANDSVVDTQIAPTDTILQVMGSHIEDGEIQLLFGDHRTARVSDVMGWFTA